MLHGHASRAGVRLLANGPHIGLKVCRGLAFSPRPPRPWTLSRAFLCRSAQACTGICLWATSMTYIVLSRVRHISHTHYAHSTLPSETYIAYTLHTWHAHCHTLNMKAEGATPCAGPAVKEGAAGQAQDPWNVVTSPCPRPPWHRPWTLSRPFLCRGHAPGSGLRQ